MNAPDPTSAAPRSQAAPLAGALHLIGLAAAALSWPLLDAAAGAPRILLDHGVQGETVVALALWGGLGLPLAVALVPLLATALHPTLGRVLQLGLVGALVALLCAPLGDHVLLAALGGDVTVVLSAVVAGAVTAAYARWALPGHLLAWLSPLPLVVMGLFLSDDTVGALRRGDADRLVEAVPSSAPVVVIVLDELPTASLIGGDQGIDPVLFPAFARLAARATWFPNASTVAEDGRLAELALLTGRRHDGSREDLGLDLFGLLEPSHRLVLFERDTRRSPAPRAARDADEDRAEAALAGDLTRLLARRLLPEPFRSEVPEPVGGLVAGAVAAGGGADDRVLRVGGFAAAIGDDAEPTLWYLSTSLPAAPWQLMPSGLPYKADDPRTGLFDGIWSHQDTLPDRAHQRHVLQLGATDRLLGRILDRLEAEGLFDRAAVVVTARRGASFTPGTAFGSVEVDNAAETVPVPLLIKAPLQTAGRSDPRNAELIDVLPTVADLLGLDIDWIVDGVSLLGDPETARKGKTVRRPGRPDLHLVEGTFDRGEALERRTERYGEHPDWTDVLGQGTARGRVGKLIAELGVAAMLPVDGHLAVVGAADGKSPSHLSGFLWARAETELPETVAIALDDHIVGTAPTEPRGPTRVAFSTLLPHEVLGSGSRSLRLFGIRNQRQLAAVPMVSYELVVGADGATRVRASDGRPVAVSADAFPAFLDVAARDGGWLRLSGWSGDKLARRAADAVLVFRGRRLVHAAPTGTPRPDIAERLGVPELAGAGFDLSLSLDALGENPSGDVRVFALLDDVMVETRPSKQARWLSMVEHHLEDDRTLRGSDGSAVAIDPLAALGEVVVARPAEDRMVLEGWAVDLAGHGPVDRIVVLCDDDHAIDVAPVDPRPEIATPLGVEPELPMGFATAIPLAWYEGSVDGRLRAFALVGERAAELHFGPRAAAVHARGE